VRALGARGAAAVPNRFAREHEPGSTSRVAPSQPRAYFLHWSLMTYLYGGLVLRYKLLMICLLFTAYTKRPLFGVLIDFCSRSSVDVIPSVACLLSLGLFSSGC
jgi:hypothetical protein